MQKKILFIFLLFFSFNSLAKSKSETLDGKIINFEPFACSELSTERKRINNKNECVIIQKLSNKYEVKSHDHDKNTWNRPQIIKFLDNKDGSKIIAHSWNNVVNWGDQSNKQPFSHLVVIDIKNFDNLFNSNSLVNSNHFITPLSLRRVEVIDTNTNGNKEIVYLANREDGRNSNSSWKDVNYIFDIHKKKLTSFGSSHFSHDLMILDFDNDQNVEVLDYFYGHNKPGAIEVCEIKTKKCKIAKNANKFVEIGFNHLFSSKKGAIIFGGCPNLGNTTFCWAEVEYKKRKLKFKKLDSYEFKKKPSDKANFLTWTGDIMDKEGYWIEGTDKKQFKMADRSWISASLDFNNDGFTDSLAIEKEVMCKRNDASKPFNRSGGDCEDKAYLYVFKNLNDSKFEKHQVIPTSINNSFAIYTADINKDGSPDIYGLKEGHSNPWMDCNREQLNNIYLNINSERFEKATEKFVEQNFGMYGCERASSFFKKDGEHYRLFITIPFAESEDAYLGIEKH